MEFISSDTNVWIDFSVIKRTEIPFRLPYTYIMNTDAIEDELLSPTGLRDELLRCGLVLMSLHLGLHWGMISGMMKKIFRIKEAPAALRIVRRGAVLIIAGYGVYAFISEHIAEYLFLRTQFAMFDYEASAVTIFTKYLAVMILFAALAYYGAKLLQRAGKAKKGEANR